MTRITRYQVVPAPGRPAPRLTIAALADLHCNTPFMSLDRVAGLVAETNALSPDLIVLLGDYAGHVLFGRELAPDKVAHELARLEAPLGVHAVFGNHDWYDEPEAKTSGRPTAWHKAFDAAGIATYFNTATLMPTDPPITLAGLESQRALREPPAPRGFDDWPALAETLDPDMFTLLLAHEPDIFPDLPDWVDLTLSGHTHGGQIAPFGIPLVVPSRYGRRYAYGHKQEGDKQLIVSGGLGCSTLPLRIGRPPEIVMVEVG